jgi:hypothetical protein
MNSYFQRLIDQSGLAVQHPLSPIPAIASISPAPVEPRDFSDANDLVELHEERVANRPGARPLPAISAPPSPPPTPPNTSAPPPAAPEVAFSTPALPGVQETKILFEETVLLPAAAPPASSILPESISPSSERDCESSEAAQPMLPPQGPSEIPAEVLQAVMSWIAAGSATSAIPSNADLPAGPPAQVSPAPEIGAPINKMAPANMAEPDPIPGHLIQIVEERVELDPPQQHQGAATLQSADALGSLSPVPEDPVRISIGTIQVRVEASVPPPARTPRRADLPRPSTSAADRASAFSKLRRHYIIPH